MEQSPCTDATERKVREIVEKGEEILQGISKTFLVEHQGEWILININNRKFVHGRDPRMVANEFYKRWGERTPGYMRKISMVLTH